MKILYDNTDGKIYYVVPDRDWFYFRHSTNIPLTEMTVDEVAPNNQTLLQDLLRVLNRIDVNGLHKYYIDTATGAIMERAGWTERPPEGII